MFTIYLHNIFHIPRSDSSLAIAVKLEANWKCSHGCSVIFLHHAKSYFNKVMYFQRCIITHQFRTLYIVAIMPDPLHQFGRPPRRYYCWTKPECAPQHNVHTKLSETRSITSNTENGEQTYRQHTDLISLFIFFLRNGRRPITETCSVTEMNKNTTSRSKLTQHSHDCHSPSLPLQLPTNIRRAVH